MMRKYTFILIAAFLCNNAQSQEIIDALRYSQDNLNGTARFRAMSGAFGALGGDLSSLNVNPAGSAIFSNNQIALSLSSYNIQNNSNYFGKRTSDSKSNFDMNQLGGVFVFKDTNSGSDWKKFSIAINYENKNNFNNSVFSAGTNPSNSISQYFLHYANSGNDGAAVPQEFVKTERDETISNLYSFLGSNLPNNQHSNLSGFAAQQAMIGFQGYVINPFDNTSTSKYISNVTSGGNYYQENSISAQGYNGKLSFNAAASYNDRLFIGMNLNSHFSNYMKNTSFYESNANALNADYTLKRLNFDNNLQTYGSGFSLQIGAIAKVTKNVRLGVAYESATWYSLTDEFSQNLLAVRANNTEELTRTIVDPQFTNYYEPYKLSTPAQWTGSFAYIFGKTGLISIDYAYKDYSTTQFRPQNDSYFKTLNTEMSTIFKVSHEFRVGAEYKIKEWSLRSGYRFEGSPYKNKTIIGDLNSFSAGVGYNFGGTKLDLSYMIAQRSSQQGFFSKGLTDGARINTFNNNLSLTLLFEL